MLRINVKQLFSFIFVGLIAISCDDDSNPMAPEEHLDAEGFALEIDGTEIYRQLEGTITGDLSVAANGTLELSIHFLDHDGNEIEHEDEEGDGDVRDEEGEDQTKPSLWRARRGGWGGRIHVRMERSTLWWLTDFLSGSTHCGCLYGMP